MSMKSARAALMCPVQVPILRLVGAFPTPWLPLRRLKLSMNPSLDRRRGQNLLQPRIFAAAGMGVEVVSSFVVTSVAAAPSPISGRTYLVTRGDAEGAVRLSRLRRRRTAHAMPEASVMSDDTFTPPSDSVSLGAYHAMPLFKSKEVRPAKLVSRLANKRSAGLYARV
jgi:hypothetical protein